MTNEQRVKTVKIVAVSLAVLFVALVVALIANLVKLASATARREDLAALSASLDQQLEHVQNAIDYRQTYEYISRYAREYLNMIGYGERPIEAK